MLMKQVSGYTMGNVESWVSETKSLEISASGVSGLTIILLWVTQPYGSKPYLSKLLNEKLWLLIENFFYGASALKLHSHQWSKWLCGWIMMMTHRELPPTLQFPSHPQSFIASLSLLFWFILTLSSVSFSVFSGDTPINPLYTTLPPQNQTAVREQLVNTGPDASVRSWWRSNLR